MAGSCTSRWRTSSAWVCQTITFDSLTSTNNSKCVPRIDCDERVFVFCYFYLAWFVFLFFLVVVYCLFFVVLFFSSFFLAGLISFIIGFLHFICFFLFCYFTPFALLFFFFFFYSSIQTALLLIYRLHRPCSCIATPKYFWSPRASPTTC